MINPLFRAISLIGMLALLFSGPDALAQARLQVQGRIVGGDGDGLPGVSVVIKGTSTGTVTDTEGNYTVSVPDPKSTLVVSFIGYVSQELAVNGRTRLDVKLLEDVKALNEVVIVGYAEQSRAKTTASVSKIDVQELRNIPSASPVQALQGKLAGVSVPVLSGQPGAAASIVIRGGTTLNPYGTGSTGSGTNPVSSIQASNPLVIVDGVFRSFNDVNPDDIESLQVLKDAASTAAYGARGANGVIIIKTKTGKFNGGKSNVTFRYQHGVETQARNYNYLNAREYLNLARRTWARGLDIFDINQKLYSAGNSATTPTYTQKGQYGNAVFTTAYRDNLVAVEGQPYVDNLLANGWETMDDPVNPGRTIIFKDSQYQDVVWNTAATNNYNIGVDGGTERASYNVSLGYIDQGGVFLGTNYKRFSSLANANFKVSDRFRLETNVSYLWNDNKFLSNNQVQLTRSVRVPPLNRLYYDNGLPALGESVSVRNRLHELYYQDLSSNNDQTTFRLAGDLEIAKGLHFRPSASLYIVQNRYLFFERAFPGQQRQRDKAEELTQDKQFMTDQILQYDNTFGGKHNLTALAGFNFTRRVEYNLRGTGQRSTDDYQTTFNGNPPTTVINGVQQPNFGITSGYFETKTASLFGQVNYDYDGRYLLGASLRYDGFSSFAPNNQYALFPSVSAGWNVHRENFWKVQAINQLKVRASYGQTGLSGLNYTDTYGGYGSAPYGGNGGILRTTLANPNLLWETTETIDGGIDLNLFNRVTLIVDVYNKLTKNRLDNLPLPTETGFNSIRYNVGKLRNRGVEVELGATVLKKGNFAWNTNFSFAFNRTTIVELPDNGRDKNRINGGLIYDPATGQDIEVGGYAEGERPGGLWAFQSNGIFATDEEAKSAPKDLLVTSVALGKPKHGGDVNWADLNGDGQIDGKDLVFIGYRVPDKIGGMQNTFTWKGFSARFTMDYALGHVISDGALARAMGQARASNEGAPREALSDETWQNPGETGKYYPRFSFGDADFGYRNHLRQVTQVGYNQVGLDDGYGSDNSIYFAKGDWLALRELSFSYQLPTGIARRIFAGSVQLNAGVYNIGYLTKYKGLNPEVYKGYDEGGYPRPRQFTFGATIRF
ncbi:SusC/RagA family TonB-linked outer membrane protein [Larkinella humicola]|uniref:SusC/RagA family TonB-linked outer membrane protein n=1 Tax=Larkinella humicola TaxID=2607654 RepID=A0A5N1JF84_9BACT|nr:SusC/RagA family TonB-linked outer membrane protein [Larkinella humicola]KAA9349389.1 SusC/RagA family TonB-linked outer membrane protein [Larkinella humicola]